MTGFQVSELRSKDSDVSFRKPVVFRLRRNIVQEQKCIRHTRLYMKVLLNILEPRRITMTHKSRPVTCLF